MNTGLYTSVTITQSAVTVIDTTGHIWVRSELKALRFPFTSTKYYSYTSLSLVRQCIYLLPGVKRSLFGKSTYMVLRGHNQSYI